VLWNIWFNNKETKVIPEMGFCWSTDPITKFKDFPILHNAGVTGKFMNGNPYFFKGSYHEGLDPTEDVHLESVLKNAVTKTKCNWYYANELKKLKNNYKLNY
jgi:hypothetical protein